MAADEIQPKAIINRIIIDCVFSNVFVSEERLSAAGSGKQQINKIYYLLTDLRK